MKALQFPGSKEVIINELDVPKPKNGEVLIRMKASGICGSDLNYLYRIPKEEKDKYVLGVWVSSTVVPGHEPCGVVEELGDCVTKLKKGDRVIVYHISGCGKCMYCRKGYHIHCNTKKTYGFDKNGSFEDFMIAKESDCVVLPKEISFSEGAYYACGAGTAFKAVKNLEISGYDTVSVFGLGPVGLAAVLLAKTFGAKVIAIDPIDIRLKLAEQIGADNMINPKSIDPVEEIMRITNGNGTSIGIECSANPAARSQILDASGLWGKVAYVGEGKDVHINVSNQIIHRQLTIIGSWVYSIPDLIELLDFVVEKKLSLKPLITNEFTLDNAIKAMKLADSGNSGKIVFKWGD